MTFALTPEKSQFLAIPMVNQPKVLDILNGLSPVESSAILTLKYKPRCTVETPNSSRTIGLGALYGRERV